MPLPLPKMVRQLGNRLIRERLDYDHHILLLTLNLDQMRVFQLVTHLDDRGSESCSFAYSSGGTRKTYLWKAIITYFRSKGLIVLLVASSSIVTLLLPLGKTAHSMFKIPIDADETSTCSISKQIELAQLIREASLIIWDEAPMTHRYTLDIVEHSLHDIYNKNQPFCGKMLIFRGDFKKYFWLLPRGAEHILLHLQYQGSLWCYCNV